MTTEPDFGGNGYSSDDLPLELQIERGIKAFLTSSVNKAALEINSVNSLIFQVTYTVELNRERVVQLANYLRESVDPWEQMGLVKYELGDGGV